MEARYLLGCETLDSQHSKLLNLLDTLHAKIGERSVCDQDVLDVRQGLIEYTMHHFSEEESLMQDTEYKDFEQHRLKHIWFIGRLHVMFRNEDGADARHSALDIVLALNSWFLNHILKEDAQVVAHVRTVAPNRCEYPC